MVNDRWKIMNSVSELEDGHQHKSQRMGCSYFLCTIMLFVAVLLAVTATGTILFMNHYQAPPPGTNNGPPLISTNQDEGNALVTVERGDGSRINIFIDPNCPDYNNNFLRLEGVQTSLLHSLTDHDTSLKSVKGQDRALLVKLAEEVAKLSAHASQLRLEYESLRRGQGNLGQELNTLQTEQGRLIQLLSESQINMVKVMNSVNDALNSMQKETGNLKSKFKADLQRAPVRSARPKGCSNGSRPRDCSDIYASGQREDGIYSVFPMHYPAGFQVFCDMTTDGGGWTVIQRREDGAVNFFRAWDAYRDGFGKITGEHWLGLKRMHALTIQANYELRIDLEDFENSTAFAQYGAFGVGLFSVDPNEDGYPLTIADYSGTAGDSMLKHNGMKFTTKDQDNDHSENNCASFYHGAWWYRNCHTSNLNGQYLRGQHTSYADGIEWSSWTGWQYSLKFAEMKIRATREENK
ncbi:fibrinogen C domain-containing protein 1 [Salvelinus alpinus]|uniref:Fibrinogen C domain-containing protein 1 n=1 Tax=Salvelinus namaycush TaxID=8040 RepID=A0A8U1BWJ5_SALNM|nr:fibrinogen C domain-containing protein 1 [Salvelinus alpinus]XP_038857198.1 fibrinogen C domain-containing protein 1 [Salvelinus namaycush]XP_055774868.1 fibrinogen C domain-containing protein 1 isoform X1 [Salvelinus fontinalis]XP_055774869.1 fibrinogen C domain-containing protein 1 isoform X1 [Salvelinus fontinalis]